MDFAEFLAFATRTFPDDGDIRYGQHWFNTLYAVRPDIADQVRGSRLDPFYKTALNPDLIPFVLERW